MEKREYTELFARGRTLLDRLLYHLKEYEGNEEVMLSVLATIQQACIKDRPGLDKTWRELEVFAREYLDESDKIANGRPESVEL